MTKDAQLARESGAAARHPVAHVDDNSGCPCEDCRQLRFQCWRVAIESGRAVIWDNGRWMIVGETFEEWEDDAA